ncbi:hypothetical protein M413DRAFT_348967 [Hebeloma cylindrosporum]|uniref:Uncharacterized protein n=1 Tax=Hebeloma cylindrosporum TaxID=76867 RepID=A0A0C3BTF8_HEBCY|nr:hypothetical protein M413DRAFT_348967 [Hebeloma cylindrosporum h7]
MALNGSRVHSYATLSKGPRRRQFAMFIILNWILPSPTKFQKVLSTGISSARGRKLYSH